MLITRRDITIEKRLETRGTSRYRRWFLTKTSSTNLIPRSTVLIIPLLFNLQIIVLTIVILALSGCVTRASTSLDPLDNVEAADTISNSDEDSRTKRSDFFSSILKKKLRLIGSLSSGKSIGGGGGGGGGHSSEHYEEPLVSNAFVVAFNFFLPVLIGLRRKVNKNSVSFKYRIYRDENTPLRD